MTGNEHDDTYNDWVYVTYEDKTYYIMRRGTLVLCLWFAGIALGGWLLTQFIAA